MIHSDIIDHWVSELKLRTAAVGFVNKSFRQVLWINPIIKRSDSKECFFFFTVTGSLSWEPNQSYLQTNHSDRFCESKLKTLKEWIIHKPDIAVTRSSQWVEIEKRLSPICKWITLTGFVNQKDLTLKNESDIATSLKNTSNKSIIWL